MKTPTSLDELVSDLKTYPSEYWLFKTRIELSEFVEETILKSEPCYLVIPERKASHLFHSFVPRLMERGFMLGSIQLNEDSVDFPANLPKKVSILVDSINEAKEMEKIVKTLEKDAKIDRIFCYLINSGSYGRLEELGIPKNKIMAYRRVPPQKYERQYLGLMPFYLSRIEPMDTGLVYDSYEVLEHLNEVQFMELITESVRQALGDHKVKFRKKKRLLLQKGVHKYSYDCPGGKKCLPNQLLDKIPTLKLFDFEFLSVDVKVSCRSEGIHFRIIVLCTPHVSTRDLGKRSKCSLKHGACYLQQIEFDRKHEKELKQAYCTQCIENTASKQILDLIYEQTRGHFSGKGYSVRRYRP